MTGKEIINRTATFIKGIEGNADIPMKVITLFVKEAISRKMPSRIKCMNKDIFLRGGFKKKEEKVWNFPHFWTGPPPTT